MELEKNNFQKFDIENFKKDIKSSLKEYALYMDYLRDSKEGEIDIERGKEYKEREIERMKTEIDKCLNHLAIITISTIKLANNRQEILDLISSEFIELEIKLESVISLGAIAQMRKNLYDSIILELLKTQK